MIINKQKPNYNTKQLLKQELILNTKQLLAKKGYTIKNINNPILDKSDKRALYLFQKDNNIKETDEYKEIHKNDDIYYNGGINGKAYKATYDTETDQYKISKLPEKNIQAGFYTFIEYFVKSYTPDHKPLKIDPSKCIVINNLGDKLLINTKKIDKVHPIIGSNTLRLIKPQDPTDQLSGLDENSSGSASSDTKNEDLKAQNYKDWQDVKASNTTDTSYFDEVNLTGGNQTIGIPGGENEWAKQPFQAVTNFGVMAYKYLNPISWAQNNKFASKAFDVIERNVQAASSLVGSLLNIGTSVNKFAQAEAYNMLNKGKPFIKIYNLTGLDVVDSNTIETYKRSNFISLPVRPDSISDNISTAFEKETPRGRTASYWGYNSTGDRELSFSVKLFKIDIDEQFVNFNKDTYLDLIMKSKSLCYPEFEGKYGTVSQPYCYVNINDFVRFMGICQSVSISYEGDIVEDIYSIATINFSFTAITDTPLSQSEVARSGNDNEMKKYL